MKQNEFIEELKKIEIEINSDQITQLEEYYKLLIEWNEKINLTAITEKEEVYLKHFYDSLTIVKVIDLNKVESLCDIGTGAGFPGLVLKILFPHLKVTLVDSLNKRLLFLDKVISVLNLNNVETIHMRAEDFSRVNREKFDVVTARAVASLPTLLEICLPSVQINGYFIPLKGNVIEELKTSEKALKELDATIIKHESFLLPKENSNRTILLIKKEKMTNKKYPRTFSEIKKKTL